MQFLHHSTKGLIFLLVGCLLLFVFLPLQAIVVVFSQPGSGLNLLVFEVSWSHTTTRYSQDSPGRVISSSQRSLPDNTRHSQQTNIHAPGGIRTHNFSKRAAEDLRLRPRGHWDRLILVGAEFKSSISRHNSYIECSKISCVLQKEFCTLLSSFLPCTMLTVEHRLWQRTGLSMQFVTANCAEIMN